MFTKKRLLIVAGPTACGKSTFLSSALGSKPSPLTKKILKWQPKVNFKKIIYKMINDELF